MLLGLACNIQYGANPELQRILHKTFVDVDTILKEDFMMKKVISLVLASLMVAVMFVGCNNSNASEMKDGTYKASFKNPEHNWTEYVELTVKDNKITAVTFDAVNADGELKSQNQEYEDMMKPDSGIGPMEFYDQYEATLLDKQDVSKIDMVTGATNSGNHLKTLVEALKGNMSKGDTAEVIVDNE